MKIRGIASSPIRFNGSLYRRGESLEIEIEPAHFEQIKWAFSDFEIVKEVKELPVEKRPQATPVKKTGLKPKKT